MALVSARREDPSIELVALALATFVPFVAYVTTASGHAYWLDGGEFVAASLDLDIAHPPGHPIAAMLGRAMAYLPIGTLAFRVAIGQALMGAVASGAFYRALATSLRALGPVGDRQVIPLALGATWLAAMASGVWFQNVRPEVYSLETALLLIVVERVVTLESRWPTLDLRPLYVASFVLGLSLANHHFMSVLLFPALAPTLARVVRAHGFAPLSRAALLGAIGLLPYVYLPVRARTSPPIDLGHPATLDNFYWVVSAQAYQGSHGLTPEPLADRFAEVLLQLAMGVHPVTIFVALAGAWTLLRAQGVRRIGWVWVGMTLFSVAGRGWLGFVRQNPDALGYLEPAMFGLSAMAASFIATVLVTVSRGRRRGVELASTVVAASLVLLVVARVREQARLATLSTFDATDTFDTLRYRDLPPRALVISYYPQTVFRHWSVDAIEHTRPDVTLVPMPFLGYPGMVDTLAERSPELVPLLRGIMLDGAIRQPDLQSLAGDRPVFVELDPRVPDSVLETVVPSGLFYSVEAGGVTDVDVREGARLRELTFDRLYADLHGQEHETETSRQLLWLHYMDAIFYARVGAREEAHRACERGLALAETHELRGLHSVLELPGRGPVDVTPYLLATPSE